MLSDKSEISPVVKSENTTTFNFEDMLVTSAQNRDYSIIVKRLSLDDMNLWTGCMPLWTNIDPYSSISKVNTDSSADETCDKNSKAFSTASEHSTDDNRISRHNLWECKHTYHSSRSCRTTSQSVFYRDMCQDTPWQSHQCQRLMPRSEPSLSRIRAQQHAAKPPPGSKFTYPVLSEKSKHDSSSEEVDTDDQVDSDATKLYSVPSEAEQHDPVNPSIAPKGTFATKTFGVKNPVQYPKNASKHPRKCPKCEYKTDSIAGINTHYKNSHEPVTCDTCSLGFSTPSTLWRHKYTHKDLKFKCNKCDK